MNDAIFEFDLEDEIKEAISAAGKKRILILPAMSLIPSAYHLPFYVLLRRLLHFLKEEGVWEKARVRFLLLKGSPLYCKRFQEIFCNHYRELFPDARLLELESGLASAEGVPPAACGQDALPSNAVWLPEALRMKISEFGTLANLILCDPPPRAALKDEGAKEFLYLLPNDLLQVKHGDIEEYYSKAVDDAEVDGNAKLLAESVLEGTIAGYLAEAEGRDVEAVDSASRDRVIENQFNYAEALFLTPFAPKKNDGSINFLDYTLRIAGREAKKGSAVLLVVDRWLKERLDKSSNGTKLPYRVLAVGSDPPEGQQLPVFLTPLSRNLNRGIEENIPRTYLLGALFELRSKRFKLLPDITRYNLELLEDLFLRRENVTAKTPARERRFLEETEKSLAPLEETYRMAIPKVVNEGFTGLQSQLMEEMRFVL